MISWSRVGLLARHTWRGASRRRTVAVAPALLLLVVLSQLPRCLHVASLFGDASRRQDALVQYASLVEGLHAGFVVVGAVLALALGASATGRRGLRGEIAPLLARPVQRSEVLLGRTAGQALVLAVFGSIPAVAFESIRVFTGSPVGVTWAAHVVPWALQLTLLAWGALLGTRLPALPATFTGLLSAWGALLLLAGSGAVSPTGPVAATARWCLPPLNELVSMAAPFASPADVPSLGALLVRTAAWTGIFLALAGRAFERADFAGDAT